MNNNQEPSSEGLFETVFFLFCILSAFASGYGFGGNHYTAGYAFLVISALIFIGLIALAPEPNDKNDV